MIPAAAAASLTITTGSLANGVDGTAFAQQLTSTGGTGTVTWKLASGSSLVTGLKLSAAGVVSGTATGSTNGPGTFSVVATDSASPAHTATAEIPYIVNPSNGGFKVSTTSLTNANQNVKYSFQLASTGGTGKVTWSLIGGNGANGLSPGLTVASTGVLSGTPKNLGEFNFWVQAKDSSPTPKTVTAFMGLIVNSATFMVATNSIGTSVDGNPFFVKLLATGGTGTVTWKLATGSSLVKGLTLSVTGAVSGTPTTSTNGPGNFSVVATDSASHTATGEISYVINPSNDGFKVTTENLPAATLNQSYAFQLASTGGTGKVTWSFINNTKLPSGLGMSTSGYIAGPGPSSTGATYLWLQAKDSSATPKTVDAFLLLVVNQSQGTSLTITSLSLPPSIVGEAYKAQLAATGGKTPYKWSLPSGAILPPELKLASSGAITGTPTSADPPFRFSVTVTDSSSPALTATANVSLPVDSQQGGGGSLSIGMSVPPAYVGSEYTAELRANNGTGPYTWSLPTAVTFPAGLKFASNGAITGKPTAAAPSFSFNVKVTDSSNPKQTATATIDLSVYALAQCKPTSPSATTNARLKGTYSFEIEQIDLTDSGYGSWTLGAFTADGKGNVVAGLFDSNGPHYSSEQNGKFTGIYSIGNDNRGLLALSIPGSTGTIDFCLALDSITSGVAGAGEMVEDDSSETVGHGRFYAQGVSAIAESSVKGSWAFGTQGSKISGGGEETRHASAGYLTLDGKGSLTVGEIDVSDDSYNSSDDLENQYLSKVPVKGTYTLAASGRGTVTLTATQGGQSETFHEVFYVAGASQILLLDSDDGYASSTNGDKNGTITAGKAWLRTTSTFNNETLDGTSVLVSQGITFNGSSTAVERKIGAGILDWNGAGSLKGSMDENSAGTITLAPGNTISANYAVDAEGRVTLSGGGGGSAPTFYLSGPNQGFGLDPNVGVGFYQLENQTVPAGGFKATSYNGAFSVGSLWYGFVQETAASAEIAVDGATESLTGTMDLNQGGDIAVDQTFKLTFTPSATGRFLLKESSVNGALYLVSPTKAYTVSIDPSHMWDTLLEYNHQ
jgi:hypothetical protein